MPQHRPQSGETDSHAPEVARVSVRTQRELRAALHGAERDEIELTAELDHLIAAAEERAWPL